MNRTPSHVTFSGMYMHLLQCGTCHWLKVSCAHVIHVSSAWCCCLDTLRPSTLHSSPSLSSSFSFSSSSSSSSIADVAQGVDEVPGKWMIPTGHDAGVEDDGMPDVQRRVLPNRVRDHHEGEERFGRHI